MGMRRRGSRTSGRGIPYAEPPSDTDRSGARGLVFNAFMASIPDQFEFLLRNWASNPSSLPTVPPVADGPDPLVGASDAPCFLRQKGRAKPTEIYFGRYVWTTGAVYAFAPSIPTLRKLAQSERMVIR